MSEKVTKGARQLREESMVDRARREDVERDLARRAPAVGEWRLKVPIVAFFGPFAYIGEWNGREWLGHTSDDMAAYRNGTEGIVEQRALEAKCREHNEALGVDHDDRPRELNHNRRAA